MNIFLIHGVNKRRELGHAFEGAQDSASSADGFSRAYERELAAVDRGVAGCSAALGLATPAKVHPIYWGDLGVRFHYYSREERGAEQSRYRPLVVAGGGGGGRARYSRSSEAQGSGDRYYDKELAALHGRLDALADGLGSPSLAELLLAYPQATLAAMLEPDLALRPKDGAAHREAALRMAQLAQRLTSETALRERVAAAAAAGPEADLKLIELLREELAKQGPQAQGVVGWGLKTMVRHLNRVVSRPLQGEGVYEALGRFFGDSVRYFSLRGSPEAPGEIIRSVTTQLRSAWAQRQPGPNVFVTHSLGGAIFYDLFTHFEPELKFDLWLSVGSQLAFYEDSKLLAASRRGVGGSPGGAKLQRVSAALPFGARWFNVFDPHDFLAFRAESVFDNVSDFPITMIGKSFLQLHTAYFGSPAFYQALSSILHQVFRTSQDVAWERLMEAFETQQFELG